MKHTLAWLTIWLLAVNALGTDVRFSVFDQQGNPTSKAVVITPMPDNNLMANPGGGTVVGNSIRTNVNQVLVIKLEPAGYNVVWAGATKALAMLVPNTNIVCNAEDLYTNLTVFNYTRPAPGLISSNYSGIVSLTNPANKFAGDGSGLTNVPGTGGGGGAGVTNNQYLPGLPVANAQDFTNLPAAELSGTVPVEILGTIPWTPSRTSLLAAVAGGEYQVVVAARDSVGLLTNATVLWPDGTYGTWSATNIDATWHAVNGYTVTYTNGPATIVQPTMLRDQNGGVTNAPALIITP